MRLQARDLARLTWLEIDLTLTAHAPPRRAHPLVVLEALLKGVFEASGLDARSTKQLWYWPGVALEAMHWERGTPIALTVQLFGLAAAQCPVWLEQLQRRFAPGTGQNFTLSDVSPWRVAHPPPAASEGTLAVLNFLTPIPLPHQPGQPNTALDGVGFIRLCQTRLRKLFGREADLPPVPELDTSAWRYWRTKHHSRSQRGHPMFLNGCIGPLTLTGSALPAWHPWLALFAAVGLGERLSFGQGRFLLQRNDCPANEPTSPATPALELRRPLVIEHLHPGTQISLDNANLRIEHPDHGTQHYPLARLSQIEVYSPCTLSSALLHACAQHGVPVAITAAGAPPLVVAGQRAEARRNRRLAAHHAAWSQLTDAQRAQLAARIVDAKLRHQALVIRQRYQAGDHTLLQQIERARRAVGQSQRLSAVRGWEGWASRHYHAWLGRHLALLGAWQGRKQHGQSPDPINALLNYGYTLLRLRIATQLRLLGLDPWLGILHQANDRHEALVSDLMEPWRPYIDRLILRGVGLRIVGAESFTNEDGAPRLTPPARAWLIQDFTRILHTPARSGGSSLQTRIRRMLTSYAQAAENGTLAHWHPDDSAQAADESLLPWVEDEASR